MAVIAVDCDEVLMDTLRSFLVYVKKHYNYDRAYEDMRHYKLAKNSHISLQPEEDVALFDEYFAHEDAKATESIVDAFHVLEHRKKAGYRLVLVTARNDKAKQLTEYQLQTHFAGLFDEIIFAQHYTEHHIPKSQIAKRVGAAYFIEDNMDYALEVAEHGIEVFLLAKPRNTHRTETHPHLHKVADWKNIIL